MLPGKRNLQKKTVCKIVSPSYGFQCCVGDLNKFYAQRTEMDMFGSVVLVCGERC